MKLLIGQQMVMPALESVRLGKTRNEAAACLTATVLIARLSSTRTSQEWLGMRRSRVAMLSSTPTPCGSSGGKKSLFSTRADAVPYTAKS